MNYLSASQAAHDLKMFASTTTGALTVAVVVGLIFLAVVFAMR